jgi:hypothetical protein
VLSNLPVVRSPAARVLFLSSAIITVALLQWARHLGGRADFGGLTPIFFVLFALFDYRAAMCALLILVFAALVPGRFSSRPLLRWIGDHPIVVAAGGAILLCVGSRLVYRNHPLAMDEYAQVFQSQIFAAGHLAGQFPAPLLDWLIPKGFQNYFLFVSESTGRVSATYWPSFALLLTPFTWLGIPWACNPVISALTLIAVHRLALRLFADREAAGLAVLMTAASPVFFANGISYYSMPAHLLANTAYALLLVQPTTRRAFAAGVVGSVALTLHNPVPHMLFALPWLVWIATRQGGLRLLGSLCAGYVPLCLLVGVGWFLFYTDLIHEGMGAATLAGAQQQRLDEIASLFALPSVTLLLAQLIGLAKVWLWAVPGLLVLAGVGAWKWRHSTGCRLLLASALATLIGYLLVPFDQGHGWGFRYFHSAWIALPLLAAGARTRAPATEERARIFEDDDTRAFVVGCILLTLVGGIGFRSVQMHEFISDDLTQMPAYSGTENRVVIIDPRYSFYGQDLVQNDPWLRGGIVRMISHGRAADAAMMLEHFPDMHRVYADMFGTVWSAGPVRTADSSH